jgi:sugar phosphate isomerase/epimerase
MRYQWPPYPADDPAEAFRAPYVASKVAMQVLEKALPHAEKYDLRLAAELHSPTDLKSTWMGSCLDFIDKTKTRHFGFCPDMSSFVTRPPRNRISGLIKEGARENVLDFITKAYQERLGPEKTVAEVKKMGGNAAEVRWAGVAGIHHFSNNDPKDLLRLVPYTYHVHAKFFEMTDDLHEYSIPYEQIIPVLVEGGYQGYLSSEYEGPRGDLQTTTQIRLQHAMLKKLLAA